MRDNPTDSAGDVVVLYNANVLTMDERQPKAQVVGIRGNRIFSVAGPEAMRMFEGLSVKRIDCSGKTVLPGFNDAHCHPLALASSLLTLDFSQVKVKSIPEMRSHIQRYAEKAAVGAWIRAVGYSEFDLAEKHHPTRRDLDKAAPHHPVKLTHRSGHACVLNSLALKLAGITTETEEPPGGFIDRELDTGEPSGLLVGMEDRIAPVVPPPAAIEMEGAIKQIGQRLLIHGITSLQDASWRDSLKRWNDYRDLRRRGLIQSRVSMMIGPDEIEKFREKGLTGGRDLGQRMSGVKIVLDENNGRLNPPQDVLNEMVLQAHQAKLQIAFHAVEETTVEAAIAALEQALAKSPRSQHRHRIEHCSVCPPALTARLKALQAVVVTQPSFLYYSGDRYLETVPEAQQASLYPLASWLRAGLRLAAGSDCPVADTNPLVGIQAASTRQTQTGQTIQASESISALQALQMYTVGSAYASFDDMLKGAIVPGKLADLVVLSDDPTRNKQTAKVTTTIIDGKLAWSSGE